MGKVAKNRVKIAEHSVKFVQRNIILRTLFLRSSSRLLHDNPPVKFNMISLREKGRDGENVDNL